jgi:hypothetical protein
MKTVDLRKEEPSIRDLLVLAKSEPLLIHSSSGEEFLLEQAEEWDREVAALGVNDGFMSFLDARSKETEDLPLSEARAKRGL